jgi:2-amino-4-hydroxy-6-hydroxymethyldihydropteridine diphosphokinase
LLEPDVVHPESGRRFAELWQEADIEQQLWPVRFQWKGGELTPAPLLLAADQR